MRNTPSYIKTLLRPTGRKSGRRVWGIDLETVWVPFFTATNVMGDTDISPASLGAPVRLAYNADGSVKFNKNGRPVTRVVKELSDSVRLIRENFTATLQQFAADVANAHADEYKAQIEAARKAGQPIAARDTHNLEQALAAMAEAEAASTAEPTAEPVPAA